FCCANCSTAQATAGGTLALPKLSNEGVSSSMSTTRSLRALGILSAGIVFVQGCLQQLRQVVPSPVPAHANCRRRDPQNNGDILDWLAFEVAQLQHLAINLAQLR